MKGSALTKDEMWRASIQKAQNGDKEERDSLVTANVGLVYMVLRRFSNRGYEQEDLFQIGAIGLMKAIDKFDLTKDFSFSTYAVPMIIGEIRRFLRDDGLIHVSRQVKDNARQIAVVKEKWKKSQNEEPTLEDLSKATGLSVEDILIAMESTTEVESIYQPVGNTADGSRLLLVDQLEDKKAGETELIDKITVGQMLATLEERERRLIELRYMEGKTQMESARALGMNQVAVSRLEKKVLLFLRQQL